MRTALLTPSNAKAYSKKIYGSSTSKYSLAGNRLREPNTSTSVGTPGTYFAVWWEDTTPDYPTNNFRFWMPTSWSPTNNTPPESDCAGDYIIQGTSGTIWNATIGNTSWTSCDGATDGTVGCCTASVVNGGVLTPKITFATDIPANTHMIWCVTGYFPNSGSYPAQSAVLGQDWNGSSTSTSQFAKLTNKSHPTGGGPFIIPRWMICTGGDGRPVGLIMGDSGAGYGVSDNSDFTTWGAGRMAYGFYQRGLDDNTTSVNGKTTKRIHAGNIACSGQQPIGSTGWEVPANWKRKYQSLRWVKDNLGYWPFDFIMNGHGGNSVGTSPYSSYLAGMKRYFQTLRSLFWQTVPIIHTEDSCPSVTITTADLCRTLGGQTAATNYNWTGTVGTSGNMWQLANDTSLFADPPDPSATLRQGFIDESIAPWRQISYDLDVNRDKLSIRSWTGSLAASVPNAASTISVSGAVAPTQGELILGVANGESVIFQFLADNVTGASSPWTVTPRWVSQPTSFSNMISGVNLSACWGTGGHKSTQGHIAYAQEVVKWKARTTLPGFV